MAATQIPNSLKRILSVTFVLIFISAFVVGFMGGAVDRANADIKKINQFLLDAEGTQPNFEKSLEVYTEETKEIIEHVLELRPESKEEYVNFIAEIESIGQVLSLDLDLQSYEDKNGEPQKTLNYNVSFYGGLENLVTFLSKLEAMHYYTRIAEIDYKDPKFLEEEQEKLPNINVKIQLYIK